MSSCVNSKIVGGCTVEPQELPWLCGLLHDGEMVCGATLLQQEPHVLVTAAHCVDQAKYGTVILTPLSDKDLCFSGPWSLCAAGIS